ncbi:MULTISPECIES: GntR family transcriptional regulator [unclassified Pseudomonas]|jgi:DNA-binding GntR family transcriptional regulator|uniref:GntR family transcriptional regulator n=1 Tax=unclassified Pseudomonas TaxID=196821 RepID=UPI00131E5D27|nr:MULTISPECIES: GntR family transcriptional regulator [unclassified Pseudomonas]
MSSNTEQDESGNNAVDQAVERIRTIILTGKYAPGERLKVGELSKELNISAMPMREALRKLEGQGLVEIEPNRGATVRKLDSQFIQDCWEINAELQILAIRRCIHAHTLTLSKIEELQRLCDAFDEAVESGERASSVRINRELHTRVVELGGNKEALRIFNLGWELISAFRMQFGYGANRERNLMREHRILVDALYRQDIAMAESAIRLQQAGAIEDLMSRMAQRAD